MPAFSIEDLLRRHCEPQKGSAAKTSDAAVAEMLSVLPGWHRSKDGAAIRKTFKFPDYFHTMAFVNAVASIAHREDHHPDLEVGYASCAVHYSTHDAGGLSINDFISAAKVHDLSVGP